MSCRRGLGDAGAERVLGFRTALEEELSREGDPLEKLAARVDFEMFRPILLRALRRKRKRRGLGDAVLDENTRWDFRKALIAAGILDKLFELLNVAIKEAGYLTMDGQIIDASIVEAPKQRNTKEEQALIKAHRCRRT